jgi:hypothetical protein
MLKDSKIIYLFIHSNDDEETLGYSHLRCQIVLKSCQRELGSV